MNARDQHQFTTDLDTAALPAVVDRATWQAQLDQLLVREKAHTRAGDSIAAARRRLPNGADAARAFDTRGRRLLKERGAHWSPQELAA